MPAAVSRVLKILALVLVVEILVLPQLGGARRALEVVGDIQPGFLVLGVALQVGAYLAHAQLTRSLVPSPYRPSLSLMSRIELSSRAVSHVVPGGAAPAAALVFRLLQRSGVRGTDAGFAAVLQGIGSAMVLHALVWLTLVVSIPLRGAHAYYQVAALAGFGLVSIFVALVVLLTRGEARAVAISRGIARRLPKLDPDVVERVVHRLSERLDQVKSNPPLVARAAGWAALHWVCNAGSMIVVLLAFGATPPLDVAIVAFGIASMLSTLPVTPAGLGVFEAAAISLLVAFGVPSAEAILGVVAYRVLSFWLPIPLGGISYLSVQASLSEEAQPVRDRLRTLFDEIDAALRDAARWVRGDTDGDAGGDTSGDDRHRKH
jgi:uncharacterized protein (TIRG00374 family)